MSNLIELSMRYYKEAYEAALLIRNTNKRGAALLLYFSEVNLINAKYDTDLLHEMYMWKVHNEETLKGFGARFNIEEFDVFETFYNVKDLYAIEKGVEIDKEYIENAFMIVNKLADKINQRLSSNAIAGAKAILKEEEEKVNRIYDVKDIKFENEFTETPSYWQVFPGVGHVYQGSCRENIKYNGYGECKIIDKGTYVYLENIHLKITYNALAVIRIQDSPLIKEWHNKSRSHGTAQDLDWNKMNINCNSLDDVEDFIERFKENNEGIILELS